MHAIPTNSDTSSKPVISSQALDPAILDFIAIASSARFPAAYRPLIDRMCKMRGRFGLPATRNTAYLALTRFEQRGLVALDRAGTGQTRFVVLSLRRARRVWNAMRLLSNPLFSSLPENPAEDLLDQRTKERWRGLRAKPQRRSAGIAAERLLAADKAKAPALTSSQMGALQLRMAIRLNTEVIEFIGGLLALGLTSTEVSSLLIRLHDRKLRGLRPLTIRGIVNAVAGGQPDGSVEEVEEMVRLSLTVAGIVAHRMYSKEGVK